jgi:tetratricopeptide (TPR) repeat protein
MMQIMRIRRAASAWASIACFATLLVGAGPAFAITELESLTLAREAYRTLAKGHSADAIKKYDEAINSRLLPPEALANALLNRALARQQLGKHEEAIADYSAALNLDAMSGDLRATALYNRGLSQHKIGHLPAAIEDYTAALLLDSELPQAFLSRGQALRESGQLLFALSDFERALLFGHPDVARINYLTGLTYEQLHRKFDARRYYEAAVTTDPNNTPAQQRLQALGEVEVATTAKTPPGAMMLAGGTSEIVRAEAGPAVEPSDELLAEAKVEMPVEKPVEKPAPTTLKIADRMPAEPTAQVAETYAVNEEASAEITSSITPAPSTLDAVPPIPERAVAPATETVGPETPAVDTVAAATQPRDLVPAEPAHSEAVLKTGWSIQLVSATSEQGAWDSWKKMQKRNKALNDMQPVVVRADLGAKGIVYRVRLTGYEAQDAAKSACNKLKSKGVTCFVSKSSS